MRGDDMDETRHDMGGTRHDFAAMPPADTREITPSARPSAARRIGPDDDSFRFGPGVTPDVIATWRSGRGVPIKRKSTSRRISGLLVTLAIAVLAGVVVWWLLNDAGTTLAATGATVHTPSAVQPCGSSVDVSGIVTTNGGGGDVSYRWRRSDGQDSGILTDSVTHGRHSITVRLKWTVTGPGRLHAVATLDVLSPVRHPLTATGAFDYSC